MCSEKNLRIVDVLLHGGTSSTTFEPLYYWYSIRLICFILLFIIILRVILTLKGAYNRGGLITGRKFMLADGWAYNRGGL